MRLPHVPRRRSAGMSMTPMIDMSFLLITFFVMTLRLSVSAQHQVELPRADQAKATHEAHPTVVTLVVDRNGRHLAGANVSSISARSSASSRRAARAIPI